MATLKRMLSALIFSIICLAALYNQIFASLTRHHHLLMLVIPFITIVTASIGILEFYHIAGKKGIHPECVLGVMLSWLLIIEFYTGKIDDIIYILMAGMIIILMSSMARFGIMDSVVNFSASMFGILYVCFPLGLLVYLAANIAGGKTIFVFILVITWLTDAGGYFGGKYFGKHKLSPRFSPNKTIEGSISGVLAALIAGVVFHQLFAREIFSMLDAVILAVLICVFGQFGDLAESAIKRDAGVKDSGNTHTGHGGMLDIIDSLLFSVPVVLFYLQFCTT